MLSVESFQTVEMCPFLTVGFLNHRLFILVDTYFKLEILDMTTATYYELGINNPIVSIICIIMLRK